MHENEASLLLHSLSQACDRKCGAAQSPVASPGWSAVQGLRVDLAPWSSRTPTASSQRRPRATETCHGVEVPGAGWDSDSELEELPMTKSSSSPAADCSLMKRFEREMSSGEVQEGSRMCYVDTLDWKVQHRSYSSTGSSRLSLGWLRSRSAVW